MPFDANGNYTPNPANGQLSNWGGIQDLSNNNMFAETNPSGGMPGLPGIGSGAPRNPFQWTGYGTGAGQATGMNFVGANAPLFSAGLQGLSQLGGLYLGLKQLSLAKGAFKLEKKAYNTNLANTTQSYNTQVGDRIAGRSYATEEERQAALQAAQLPTPGG